MSFFAILTGRKKEKERKKKTTTKQQQETAIWHLKPELRGLFTSPNAALLCSLLEAQRSSHTVLGPCKLLIFFCISYCTVRTRAENIHCESQAVRVPEQYLQSIHAGIANCAFLLWGYFNVQSMFEANWDQDNIKSPHVLQGCTASRHFSFLRPFHKLVN